MVFLYEFAHGPMGLHMDTFLYEFVHGPMSLNMLNIDDRFLSALGRYDAIIDVACLTHRISALPMAVGVVIKTLPMNVSDRKIIPGFFFS